MSARLTDGQRRALGVLAAAPGGVLRPREFARAFFPPDSPGWRHPTKSGNKGTHRGGIMYLTGGAYLGKLARRGLVAYTGETGYRITLAGRTALAAAEVQP